MANKADKIVLQGLEFHGYHGAFPEETKFGARFLVDLEMYLELPDDDDLEKTVGYHIVYELVKEEVTEERYDLIETLAHKIAEKIMKTFTEIQFILVRVHKPHAPLPGVVRDVYVEVNHSR